MSLYQFFASSLPIEEKINPNIELLSLEEAENRGIELPDWFPKDMHTNRKEKILLFAPNEDCLDDIEIRTDNHSPVAQKFSNKQYISSLHWRYSESRAQELITFIAEHLKTAPEIEIWNTWLGDEHRFEVATIKRCYLNELTASALQKTIGQSHFDKPNCLIVKRAEEKLRVPSLD